MPPGGIGICASVFITKEEEIIVVIKNIKAMILIILDLNFIILL